MGDWLEKLERKYYRYSIPNLPAILAGGQVAVLVILLLFRSDIGNYLMLDRAAILHGQIWRLITFVFIPQGTVGSSISLVLTLLQIYFLYFAGKALENAWGQFKLTVFTLAGMLGCILACLLLPGASVLSQLYGMIAMSAFQSAFVFAFACVYPEAPLLFMFVIGPGCDQRGPHGAVLLPAVRPGGAGGRGDAAGVAAAGAAGLLAVCRAGAVEQLQGPPAPQPVEEPVEITPRASQTT